ncbi:MAG: DUF2062 domain-containing protein [Desulfococcaceae bacterium]|jgi:uncharacterized protein (DUF2062 family)|nr:DUF2062 domain-containing protein [Desulfococcaceae bacterium]
MEKNLGGFRNNPLFISLQKSYDRFVRIRGNPREIALGFALGVFIGTSPTMGVQMLIAVFFAALLKWNKFAAAAGAWISNPLTAPFLYSLTYFIGAKVLSYEMRHSLPKEANLDALICMLKQAPEILWIMTVGGVIVGIPLALAAFYFARSAILKYRESIQKTIAKEKKILSKTKENIKKRISDRKKRKKQR